LEDDDLRRLWRFLARETALLRSDVIFVFGSADPRVAHQAFELHARGIALWVLVSGGTTGGYRAGESEADAYREVLQARGMPTDHCAWRLMEEMGHARFVDSQRTVTFSVSAETFDQIREAFRPFEARDFHCNRVATDGPYGFIIWSSREGQEDQRTQWDAGCLTGDASDLFSRIDAAMEVLVPMREAAAAFP
jgi:hypothetical protein